VSIFIELYFSRKKIEKIEKSVYTIKLKKKLKPKNLLEGGSGSGFEQQIMIIVT
jgi:hypothetical protein